MQRHALVVALMFAGIAGTAGFPRAEAQHRPRQRAEQRPDAKGSGAAIREERADDSSFVLEIGGLHRQYIVHVPSGFDREKPMPVVIMFHGGGGTARGTMRETGWADMADRAGFIAVFPEATRPDLTQPARFGVNGQAWNDGSGSFHSGEKDIADVAFIEAMIDDLIARFAVDQARIYATGFSNGASMAFRIGVALSSRIAAVAPVAGTLWVDPQNMERPVSLYYISGDADPLNPIEGGTPKMATGAPIRAAISRVKPPAHTFVADWARALHCPVAPATAPAAKGVTTSVYAGGCDGGAEVRFSMIQGQGHIWPGGKNLLPERMVGGSTDHVTATKAIWEFFRGHARQGVSANAADRR